MTKQIEDIFPVPEDLLMLSPEEIAKYVLEYICESDEHKKGHLNRYNFTLKDQWRSYAGRSDINKIVEVIMEAWMWLEGRRFLAPKPGSGGDWRMVTREGKMFFEDLKRNKDDAKEGIMTRPKAFISYSTKDKKIASKIKLILDRFNISGFLAHDDMKISEEWKQRIEAELQRADVFIALLSVNFKGSDWTSQELGIAYSRKILIIPLSTDKTTPFGFINHIQGKNILETEIPLQYLITPILERFPISMISSIVNAMDKIYSFREAEEIMGLLVPYFDKFEQLDIERFVGFSIDNGQIWYANKCKKEYLPEFIDINKDKISESMREQLNKKIR